MVGSLWLYKGDHLRERVSHFQLSVERSRESVSEQRLDAAVALGVSCCRRQLVVQALVGQEAGASGDAPR